MGGNKKSTGLKRPTLVYHSSIPAHIRSFAQNITGSKATGTGKSGQVGRSLDQSVGFIAESPTKSIKKSANVKKTAKLSSDGDRKKSPARHSQPLPATSPVSSRRPTSLQTNVSSGYESEYQSSEVGSSWDWTAAEIIWKWQNNNLKTKKVYTDWANHYLDKAKCKKHIQDLQVDVTDGVVLADVIEAVTNHKIADINRKPKTSMQMIENIKNCLAFLASIGVSLDGITAKDVREGNLKAILGLFFSLSRHKQKQKQQHQLTAEKEKLQRLQQEQKQQVQQPQEDMPQPRLPSPYKHGGMPATNIPMPSATLARRTGMDKTRLQAGLSGSGLHQPTSVYKCTSASSSRSASPCNGGQFISIPRPATTRNSLIEKQLETNGLKHPSLSGSRTSLRIPAVSPYSQSQTPVPKNSMLEKFRLFKEKDSKIAVTGNSKRTSSSSGFSSAKSEHSDSSTSLCSDAKQTGSAGDKSESALPTSNGSVLDGNSKLRGLRTKLAKTSSDKKQSSPKLKRMIDTEPRNNIKQIVKPEKIRGIADGERKIGGTVEGVPSQDKLNIMELEKESKPKAKPPPNKADVSVSSQEPPAKTIVSTGIPKPMAAVKGTTKVSTSADMSPVKMKSPSIPRIHLDTDRQNREDVCIAMVSPMRTSMEGEIRENDEQKRILPEPEKKLKDVEEEEVMNVKPMSPLMNGYRLAHSNLHFTHPGYLDNAPMQDPKKLYTSHTKPNPNLVNLESMDLAMQSGQMLSNMNKANLMQDGYASDSVYSKRKDERPLINGTNSGSKVNGSIDKSFEIPPQHSVPKEKSSTAGELSSDQSYFDDTKGLVGSSPNQWPSQGEYHQSPITYRSGISRSSGRKSDTSQQTDGSAFRAVHNSQWKKYPPEEANKVEEHRAREGKSPVSNGTGRKSKATKEMVAKDECGSKQTGGEGKTKVKGVPSSFGYVKRSTNGSAIATKSETRTAQVSAVPRTKVKVSGGTQTTSDLTHFKSYSLTGSSANQLSQCVRERLLGSQSLPKPGSSEYAALFHQHRQSQRQHKPTDGSLSDTTYATYSELQSYYANNSPYNTWMRNSSTYTASLPSRTSTGLANAESLESLNSLPAQLQHRASLTHTRLLMNQREGSSSPSHRLNRSNSIRSTKSEKLYPSMLQRSDETDPYYGIPISSVPSKHSHASQPTSPTPSQVSQAVPSRFNYPLSPISSSSSGHGLNRGNLSIYSPGSASKTGANDDDIHGSSISLVSTASSLYSTAEEKQAHEIRKLRKELLDSQEKVYTLTSQLSTNAHVVSAFEKSLSSMTQRLQNLMATTEKKDQELLELRRNIELLRKQGKDIQNSSTPVPPGTPCLSTRHQNNNDDITVNGGAAMTRQLSTDSVSSLNSLSSACSISSSANCSSSKLKKKKKVWLSLRSSFNKALSKSRKNKNGSVSDVEDFRRHRGDGDIINTTDLSAPSSPLLNNHALNLSSQNLKASHSSSDLYKPKDDAEDMSECDLVEDLKKQLREKDLVLTDIRLEALSSAHQLESLKDTVIKMRNELLNLKQDNERLQRIVTSKSLSSSQTSINHLGGSSDKRLSLHETSLTSLSNGFAQDCEGGKRALVSVLLGSHGVFHKYMEDNCKSETVIATIHVSPKTQWETLDSMVRKMFKEYVQRLDPSTGLGLSGESIWSYHIGDVVRYKESPTPDLLPYGHLIQEEDTVRICLKGAMHSGSLDALAFETLIPKSIIQRYISLLSEHRRIILCGPSGTGKSYLANKLSEFLVSRTGKESTAESIATFNVDHKNSKELRQYLTNVAEQCETNASDLPSVIILDNLHQATSLGEVFNGFLSSKYSKCPFIIGTMNQATCSTTNLQLHHNFRWILCANHMEPVKGFLSRYLRRRTLDRDLREGIHNNDFARIIEWIPKVWHHLNRFIEMHTSSDVTIGPRLFLMCPVTVEESRIWFTDLWNYAVVPYLMDAVREGLQLYGKRAAWEDPTQFVLDTYPWADERGQGGQEALLRIRPEDVGFDMNGSSDGSRTTTKTAPNQSESGDPLLNMLMRLQEAANYTRGHLNGNDVTDVRHTTEAIPEILGTSKTSESCI